MLVPSHFGTSSVRTKEIDFLKGKSLDRPILVIGRQPLSQFHQVAADAAAADFVERARERETVLVGKQFGGLRRV